MPFTSEYKGNTAVYNVDWVFPISGSREVIKENFTISNKAQLFFEIHKDLKRVKKEGNAQGSDESLVVFCRFESLSADGMLQVKVRTTQPLKKELSFSTGFMNASPHFERCSESFMLPSKWGPFKLQVEVTIWSSSADAPKKVTSIDWSSDKIADFTFVVDGTDFKVHKAICIARSVEFRKVFIGSVNNTAIIDNISKDDFKEFLHFIYTQSLEFTNVLNMLFIARKFNVKLLLKACIDRLRADLSEATAEEVFFAAHKLGCDDGLTEAAYKLIQAQFTKINCKMPDSLVGNPNAVKDAIEKKRALVVLKKAVDDSEKAIAELKKALEEAFIAEDKAEDNAEDHNYAKR